MGRHVRPEAEHGARPIAMAVRHAIPASATSSLDAPTTPLRAVDPVPTPVPVPADGPPARLSRRDRRAARHEQEARVALAARLSRAQRRNRQVAAFVPGPRTPDPAVSGPLAVARPPWSS
jgi:hypothetical protein